MIHELFSRLRESRGDAVAGRMLRTELEGWYVPVQDDTLRLEYLTTPFRIVRDVVSDKLEVLEILDELSRPYVENQPSADKLGFYHHEDSELPRVYASVRSYSFRSNPPSWLNFDGYVDVKGAKGYQKFQTVNVKEAEVVRIDSEPWQLVKHGSVKQNKPCSFRLEFEPNQKFNYLVLRFQLTGVPYFELNSITAGGLELLNKRVLVQDEQRLVFRAVESERIVASCSIPEHLYQHKLDPFEVKVLPQRVELRRYDQTYRLEQTIPVEHDKYDISVLSYEPPESSLKVSLYDGQDLVAVWYGGGDYELDQTASFVRVVVDQTGTEDSCPVLRRVFIGGWDV